MSVAYYVYNGLSVEREIDSRTQNMLFRNIANELNLPYKLSSHEFVGVRGRPILRELLNDQSVEKVVLYSIFMLPDDYDMRADLVALARKTKTELFFASEYLTLEECPRGFLDAIFEIKSVERTAQK